MSIIAWSDVTLRYNVLSDFTYTGSEQASIIQYAEAELSRRLSNCYTVPFSNNNVTAKDLVIDIAFSSTIKYKDSDKYTAIMDQIDSVTEKLCGGQASMVDDTGALVTPAGTSGSGKVYSSTQDFPPIFDMGSDVSMYVSSTQLAGEADAKD